MVVGRDAARVPKAYGEPPTQLMLSEMSLPDRYAKSILKPQMGGRLTSGKQPSVELFSVVICRNNSLSEACILFFATQLKTYNSVLFEASSYGRAVNSGEGTRMPWIAYTAVLLVDSTRVFSHEIMVICNATC